MSTMICCKSIQPGNENGTYNIKPKIGEIERQNMENGNMQKQKLDWKGGWINKRIRKGGYREFEYNKNEKEKVNLR